MGQEIIEADEAAIEAVEEKDNENLRIETVQAKVNQAQFMVEYDKLILKHIEAEYALSEAKGN